MTVVASDVFPSIHALLTRSGLKKAAAALAKEAKLQPKAFESQHDLVEVFSFYMKQHNGIKNKGDAVPILKDGAVKKVQKKKKKKEDSIEAEDEKQVVVKKGPVSSSKKEKVLVQGEKKSSKRGAEKKKKGSKKAVAEKKEVESSSSDSSDSSDEEVGETKTARSKKAADKVKTKAKEEDSSDSDDKVQSNTLKRKIEASSAAKNVKKAKRDADSSSNDSSSSDDDSSDSSDSSDFSDSSDDEEARTKENARRDEAAKAALEWQPKKMEKVATKAKSAGTPFQRVDGEFWSQKIVNDTLRDNSYEGTFGTDGVGVKANTKLLKTRGKDFTKGKNKLKRSTYMCGAISMASNSFKFDE